jgi:DNA-binding NarL/FixJ family response regulator
VIRVMLAEDHSLVRAGLADLLANVDDFEVVGAAADGSEAVSMASDRSPQVVLMDLVMPELDGIEATRRILAADPAIQVVVLTSFSDRARIVEALDAGAIGFLLKDAEPDELFRGIRAAAKGESPLAPKAAKEVLLARSESRSPGLTERELDVLGLVRAGLSNKLIARRLEISEKTVKAHLTSVFQRIGVTDRTQAALWAERHGVGHPRG